MPCLQKNGAVTPQYRQRLCPTAQGRFFSCRIRSVGRAVVSKNHRPLVRIHPHENSNFLQTENRQRISTLTVFLWARVDCASRAAKNSPLGCFCPFFCDGAAAVRIHPHENQNFLQTENRQRISTLAVFLWARVDYARRAAKNSPLGCFCPFFCDGAAAVRIRPHENPNFLQTENRQRISTLAVFLWARVDSNHRS